jgi:hypothetical protein
MAFTQRNPLVIDAANGRVYTSPGCVQVATAAGTTTLTNTSARQIVATGSSTQTFALPDATQMVIGEWFEFINQSTGNITIKDNAGTTLLIIPTGFCITFTLALNATAAGVWAPSSPNAYSDMGQRAAATADANTVLLWPMINSGSTGETDLGSYGIALNAGNSPASTYGPGGLNAKARVCGVSNSGFYSNAIGNTANAAFAGGAWTVMTWLRIYDNPGTTEGMLCYVGGSNASADENNVPLIYLAINLSSMAIKCYQYTTHSTVNSVSGTSSVSFLTNSNWNHIAICRTAPSGGNITFTVYVNGMPITLGSAGVLTGPSTTAPTGNHYVDICGFDNTYSGGAPNGEPLHADVSDFSISNIARTQAQVRAAMLAARP